MIFHILLIAPLLLICSGESAPSKQSGSSNYAISSQSYHRDDVPLSYKYSAIHVYTTTLKPPANDYKQHNQFYEPKLDPVNFRSLQYAPLIKATELRHQNGLHTNISAPYASSYKPTVNKDHLEPRLPEPTPTTTSETKNFKVLPHLSYKQYIPGHNIEVLQSVNRSPAHNTVYRSYVNNPSEKISKVNYLRQYKVHQEPQQQYKEEHYKEKITSPIIKPESPKLAVHGLPSNTIYEPEQNRYYHVLQMLPMEKMSSHSHVENSPYSKMHALILNVARAYNLALTPRMSLHPGAKAAVFAQPPTHNRPPMIQAPGHLVPLTEQKTKLYPIQNNMHFDIHS